VQTAKPEGIGNLEPPPDLWLNADERDLQLEGGRGIRLSGHGAKGKVYRNCRLPRMNRAKGRGAVHFAAIAQKAPVRRVWAFSSSAGVE